jgi:hypothetical protein
MNNINKETGNEAFLATGHLVFFALSGSAGQLQSSINIKIMIKVEIMCHVWELYWQP